MRVAGTCFRLKRSDGDPAWALVRAAAGAAFASAENDDDFQVREPLAVRLRRCSAWASGKETTCDTLYVNFLDGREGVCSKSHILCLERGQCSVKRIKILAIVGSLRQGSYNRQLAMLAKEIVGDRADFEILEHADVPLLNQDYEWPPPEPVKRVREAVKSADGLWFFTPEYNHYFPGVLKNLIDWLSLPVGKEPPVIVKKPCAISGTTIGMHATACAQDHLVTLLSYLDADVMNKPRLTIPYILEQVDSEGRVTLSKSRKYLERQADAFLEFVEKCIECASGGK